MEVFVWREIHITDSYEEIFYYTTYKIAYISVLVFRRLREFWLLIPINSKQNRRQRDILAGTLEGGSVHFEIGQN